MSASCDNSGMDDRLLHLRVGATVKELRRAILWTQRELAARSGVSQPLICAIENGRLANLTFARVNRLLVAMGGRLMVDVARPWLGDRPLQRDPAHVRCVTYVRRRLERAGWLVMTEVEIGGDRSRGWIDLLAIDPRTGTVLVIEVKSEIHDIGAIERALGWYEREAWAAARRIGWRPLIVIGCLLVLATDASDSRIQVNRAVFDRDFPLRWRDMVAIVSGASNVNGRRALAMIDPRSRRRDWTRPTRIDGRRSAAPYADYVAFMSRIQPTVPAPQRSSRSS